jgi:hypothetical protein
MPKDTFFHVRGFPESLALTTVDVDYTLSIEVGKVSFNGFSGLSSIINIAKENAWQLISNGNAIGHYNGTNSIPIGLCEWYLYNTTNSKVELKLSQVICLLFFILQFI